MIVIYGLHTWWVGAISAPFLESTGRYEALPSVSVRRCWFGADHLADR